MSTIDRLMDKVFLLFFIICFFSCNNQEENKAADLAELNVSDAFWLSGFWADHTTFSSFNPSKVMFESWEKYQDSMVGSGGFIKLNDTVITEKMLIKVVSGSMMLIVRPKERAMISFPIKHQDHDSLVFENKSHDFPQRITYHKINSDSALVYLVGVSSEQKRRLRLTFSRAAF